MHQYGFMPQINVLKKRIIGPNTKNTVVVSFSQLIITSHAPQVNPIEETYKFD
jgi:hypothetical protein